MLGDAIPCKELIIESVQDVHGKENIWLVQVYSGKSNLVGYVTGWHAVG